MNAKVYSIATIVHHWDLIWTVSFLEQGTALLGDLGVRERKSQSDSGSPTPPIHVIGSSSPRPKEAKIGRSQHQSPQPRKLSSDGIIGSASNIDPPLRWSYTKKHKRNLEGWSCQPCFFAYSF